MVSENTTQKPHARLTTTDLDSVYSPSRISHRISRTCMHRLHIHRPQLGHIVTRVLLQQMDTSSMVNR
eukprot:UN02655